MLKNKLNCVFRDSIQQDFRPLAYDPNRENTNTALMWPKIQNASQEMNKNSRVDNSRLLEMEIKPSLNVNGAENVELGGFEVGLNKDSTPQNEVIETKVDMSYNEIPKFLISYPDIYQDFNSSQGCGLDDFENVEFNNKLLEPGTGSSSASQNCWTENVLDQHFPIIASGNAFPNSLSGTEVSSVLNGENSLILEEDNGILDLLTQALNKTYLNQEKGIGVKIPNECSYSMLLNRGSCSINKVQSTNTEINNLIGDGNVTDFNGDGGSNNDASKATQIESLCVLDSPSNPCGNTVNTSQNILGIRIFTKEDSTNKRVLSKIQLNTFDLLNLCSRFGNVLDVCVCNDGYYITYETRNSLENALSSLENLPVSSEGDFMHVFLHQTSNKIIGGIGRSINNDTDHWNGDFCPLSYPGVKDVSFENSGSESINLIENVSILSSNSCGNTSTSFSSTLSTSTGNSATARTPSSGGLTIGNTIAGVNMGSNSPWDNYDNNSIATYENDLWTSLINDGANYNLNEGIGFVNLSNNNGNVHLSKDKDNNKGEDFGIEIIKENETNRDFKGTLEIGDAKFNTVNKSSIKTNVTGKVNNGVTYSSIVGSNINKSNKVDINLILNNKSDDFNHKTNKTLSKLSLDNKTNHKNNSEPQRIEKLQIETAANSLIDSPSSSSLSSGSTSSNAQNSQPLLKKYTARYEIQIPPDNQFQIARRIIGTRGVNMKKIFKQTQSKLRLRGRGSGYLEGYNKQEADEPLHLCISSTNSEQYNNAKKLVEKLLLKIYQEYDDFLISNNENHKLLNLELKYKETMRTKQSGNPVNNSGTGSHSKHK